MTKNSIRNPQVNIRLPELLREEIKKIADEDQRSMNFVVVQALKNFVEQKTKPQLR